MKGRKVVLRPIREDDIEVLNQWRNSEEIYKYLGGGYLPISIDHQKLWMSNMIDNTGSNKRFMICDIQGQSIGMIGLYSVNFINQNCEIGMYIGEDTQHRKGFGSEAYELIEHYAKNYLHLKKIKLLVVESNEKAVKFWYKHQYEKIGCLQSERYIDGNFEDVLVMEKFI